MKYNEAASPLLATSHLRKTFGDTLAVADVSFDVYGSEVFGLLGPNGAGKTTTIRMILDIFKPDSGDIEVLGGKLTPARSDRIGYMPEERGLYPGMRVLQCLVYLGSLKGMPRKEARKQALVYLERMELAGQHRTRISALSRGMTQYDRGAIISHEQLGGKAAFSSGDYLKWMAIYLLIYFVEIASSFTSGYMYGSIASESRTRTIEILLTSVSTVQFIAGKFAGLLAVGITQLTIWGAPLIVAVLVLTSIRGVSYLAWFFPLEYTGLVISTLLASYISILADSDRCQ